MQPKRPAASDCKQREYLTSFCFPRTPTSQHIATLKCLHIDQKQRLAPPCRMSRHPPNARGTFTHHCSRVPTIADSRTHRCDLTLSFSVRVGQEPNQQSFSVYHDLITQRSAHLRALRVEQTTNFPDLPVIILGDCDPEVFNAYLQCVYFGPKPLEDRVAAMIEDLDDPNSKKTSSDDENDDMGVEGDGEAAGSDAAEIDETASNSEKEPVEKFLVDLYLLAIKLIDPTTANLAIDELIGLHEFNCHISKEMVAFVYYSTAKNSKLRLLYRDLHIHRMRDSWLVEVTEGTQYPYEFVGEVVRRIWRRKRSQTGMGMGVTHLKDLYAASYYQDVDGNSAESVGSVSVPKEEE